MIECILAHLLYFRNQETKEIYYRDLSSKVEMENITMPQEPLPLAEATSGSSDNETISKSYKCALCPSMFSQKSHLTTHVDSVHLKKKNYFCDKCDYASTRKGTLEKHIQAVHDKIKPFTCEVCSQKFNQKVHMNAHYDAIHLKRKLQCPDCDYAASRYDSEINI